MAGIWKLWQGAAKTCVEMETENGVAPVNRSFQTPESKRAALGPLSNAQRNVVYASEPPIGR